MERWSGGSEPEVRERLAGGDARNEPNPRLEALIAVAPRMGCEKGAVEW